MTALAARRDLLRAAWADQDPESGSESDSEEFRNALRQYREITQRLLQL